jgi:hypothetical protein
MNDHPPTRPAASHRRVLLLAVLASLGPATHASAVAVPGGGKAAADCAAGFEVQGLSNPSSVVATKTRVDQLACDGSCTFDLRLCVNEVVAGCTPPAVTGFRFRPSTRTLGLPSPLGGADHLCGPDDTVKVALKGGRAAMRAYKVTAITSGRRDRDKLVLRCRPNPNRTGCGQTGCGLPEPPVSACPGNPDGGPDQVVFTVLGRGTDLDNGWTGTSHNFPVIKDASLTFCLCGCDAFTDPTCTATAPTGAGSLNGATFGPPLPLIAGGVPVCVVNRFAGAATGTADVQTGEMNGNIPLLSDVFATDPTRVCPQCLGGTCDSGARRGQACTVDGTVTVAQSLAANKNFQLSRSCPPLGNPLSTLTIDLPITTGSTTTPGTGGSKPCRDEEAQGVPVKDNNCSAGCAVGSCTGNACVSKIADPSNPGAMICIDAKGGLSQACCNDNTSVPCFDTGPGGAGLNRTGRPGAPAPAWPDPTYPKSADGLVTVATFCEAATGSSNIDTVTGLPGPGAVVFNTRAEWQKLP